MGGHRLISARERESHGLLRPWALAPLHARPPLPKPAAPLDPEVRCILALSGALLGYGLPAHRIEEVVTRLSHALGRECSVFGLPTALLITLNTPKGAQSHAVRAEPGTTDLARLDALYRVVARVESRELDPPEAERQVAAILSAPRALPRFMDLLAVAMVGSGGTLMMGADLRHAAWAALLGAIVGALLWLASLRPALSRVLPVLSAVVITLACSGLAHAGLLRHPLVVALAALFVLLPGLTLTLAMMELATGHLVSGTARSMGAAVVFLQLGLGMLLGLRLGHLSHARLAPLPPAELAPASAGALVLASGFAVLFAVRRADVVRTLFVSALAFFICRVGGAALGVEIGVLLAATAVGVYSHAFARINDRPSSALTLPGVTMLVPGSLGLLSVSAAALHDASQAFDIGFQMLMVVIALSTGILLATAALPPRTEL